MEATGTAWFRHPLAYMLVALQTARAELLFSLNQAYETVVLIPTPLPIKQRSLLYLRLIAAFKLLKALFVIATAIGILRFYDSAIMGVLLRLAHDLPYTFEQNMIRNAISFLSGLSPRTMRAIAAGTFAYSGLFILEAWGLWFGRHWAEILTVVATCSLIPIELYEIARHVSALKIGVLILNMVILLYLVLLLRYERRAARAAHTE